MVTIDAQGYSGGIALAWNQEAIQMDTYWTTRRTITTQFHYRGTDIQGFITLVYGPNAPEEKQAFLDRLHYTSSLVGEAYWIIGGDFNMITSLTEKKDGFADLKNKTWPSAKQYRTSDCWIWKQAMVFTPRTTYEKENIK